MKPFTEFRGGKLEWKRVARKQLSFELRSDVDVYARLRWLKSSGSLATGEVSNEAWTFKRIGFLKPQITARAENSSENLAVYSPGLRGGALTFSDGRQYRWGRRGFVHLEWTFLDRAGKPLMRFSAAGTDTTPGACVDIAEREAMPDIAPFLTILGWYLILMSHVVWVEDADNEDAMLAVLAGLGAAS